MIGESGIWVMMIGTVAYSIGFVHGFWRKHREQVRCEHNALYCYCPECNPHFDQ